MTKVWNTAGSRPKRGNAIDLDVSAVLIGERSIGEIFGWALVDWTMIESHRGRRFHFGQQVRQDPSIHDQLKPLFESCHPEPCGFGALKPSPVVNINLTKLVGYLCRHFGHHHLPTPETDSLTLKRTIEQEKLHQRVVTYILKRVDNHPALGRRAGMIKQAAAAAESELEKHFANLINTGIEANFLLDRHRIKSLREQAKVRMDETLALNAKELAGLTVPDLRLDEDSLVRIEMTKILLHRFPYVRNYELMLFAELAMLQQPLTPRFVRERALASPGCSVDEPTILRLDQAVAGLAATSGYSASLGWRGSLAERTIVFCGSGPLPLSALLLHLMTGANVVLVDNDHRAIACSQRLIANLEKLEILAPGALKTVRQDAGCLSFESIASPSRTSGENPFACDAVMIASLVDPAAKSEIARQFRENSNAPELLIMRSATALSARLAYDPVNTEEISSISLAYCGETQPATQVATHLNRIDAINEGVICPDSRDLLATAHPDVVNTTEIYRRLRSSINTSPPGPVAGGTMDQWINRLEQMRNGMLTEAKVDD